MPHDFPDALGWGDMVLAARLHVGRRLHRVDIDWRSSDADPAFLGQLVPLVEVLEIVAVPTAGEVGRVAVPMEQVERRRLLAQEVIVDYIIPDKVAAAQQVE